MLKTPANLIIRADASTEIGTGHVMRCLALAQTWQDAGGKATFVMATKSAAIETRLRSEGTGVVYVDEIPGSVDDAIQTLAVAEQHNAQWIVIDGYQFGGNYQRKMKDSGRNLLFIDDYGHADYYCADFVLNQNIHAHAGLYANREPFTKLLLGTRFVLLRHEFLGWQGWKREVPPMARRIMVTFGGSDDQNVTCKVIRALKRAHLDGTEVGVIVGLTNPHLGVIREELGDSTLKIQHLSAVNDMATLMASADIAISAAGSTCWELAFMGLPSFVLPLADNQVAIAEELDSKGISIRLDTQELDSNSEAVSRITHLMRSQETRLMMMQEGQKLVDGEGTERVLMHMRGERLRLRRIQETDCKLLWEWANDPEVRLFAFSSEPIPWDTHVGWLTERLQKPDAFFFIALDDQDVPVGQVRFDINESKAQIDVSIDKGKRGFGYSPILIERGVEELFRRTPVKEIHAFVKLTNQSSIRAFEKAKFERVGIKLVENNETLHYVVKKYDA
jgi:UDP-2,4-diacetamido-2,4,6-trideoxy-beta-L-altropyranose hydrolase